MLAAAEHTAAQVIGARPVTYHLLVGLLGKRLELRLLGTLHKIGQILLVGIDHCLKILAPLLRILAAAAVPPRCGYYRLNLIKVGM